MLRFFAITVFDVISTHTVISAHPYFWLNFKLEITQKCPFLMGHLNCYLLDVVYTCLLSALWAYYVEYSNDAIYFDF